MSEKKHKLPDIVRATADFEKWASRHVRMVQSDVKLSTGTWPKRPSPFSRYVLPLGPVVAAHLPTLGPSATGSRCRGFARENSPGATLKAACIWGVNDFDEAWPASYVVDLFAWFQIAIWPSRKSTSLSPERSLPGHRAGLPRLPGEGGAPFVLAEHHRWLRLVALNKLRDQLSSGKDTELPALQRKSFPRTF